MRRFLPVPAGKWMGEGPLLLFLHGIGGNKDVFDQQLPAFADGWRTAAWDMPGYGESELQGEMTFELLADSVAQLLDDLGEHDVDPETRRVRFIAADYTDPLPLADQEFDLLVSLYAGFVSESCTQHLRVGGTLLVNPSHGDAAMASIDARYRLAGIVRSRSGTYSVSDRDLDTHLVPKKDVVVTKEALHASGRAIAYTKSAFAYLFERVA